MHAGPATVTTAIVADANGTDDDLRRLVAAWPALPAVAKAEIMGILDRQ